MIKKRIGIITVGNADDREFNYGNDLQNYALTTFLRLNGFYTNRINYISFIPNYTKNKENIKPKKSFTQFIDDVLRILKRNIYKKEILKKREHRVKGFEKFIFQNLSYTTEKYTKDSDFTKLNNDFDFFISGSDQVWNPLYEGSNEFYYLTFADYNKRIAFAPSIGLNQLPDIIPNYKINEIKKWISEIKYLSIREQGGKKLLKEKYGVDASLVCDPVFLLSAQEWRKIREKNNVSSKNFVIYILGKKTINQKKQILKLEKKFNKKGIDLYSRDDKNSMFCTPGEFINSIDQADFIVTNSFHGAAFAQILNKPLVILSRDGNEGGAFDMSGRISNLLSLVELKDRDYNSIISGKTELYKTVNISNTKLGELINYSKKYLLEALNNNK